MRAIRPGRSDRAAARLYKCRCAFVSGTYNEMEKTC